MLGKWLRIRNMVSFNALNAEGDFRMDNILDRRDFLKAMGLGVASFAVPGCAGFSDRLAGKVSGKKPNIVFIMSDDVGQEVLGCYGGTS